MILFPVITAIPLDCDACEGVEVTAGFDVPEGLLDAGLLDAGLLDAGSEDTAGSLDSCSIKTVLGYEVGL